MLWVILWCPEEESNLHALRHTDLNRARLPIPPPGPSYLVRLIVSNGAVNGKIQIEGGLRLVCLA